MSGTFMLPDLGEGIHEAEILSVRIQVGDRVKEGDIVLEVETDKAIVELPSPNTGTVAEVHVQPGDRIQVGHPLLSFQQEGAPSTDQEGGPSMEPTPSAAHSAAAKAAAVADGASRRPSDGGSKKGVVPASPATRRLALELGVALDQVVPSGPEGLVTAADVRAFAEKGAAGAGVSLPDAAMAAAPGREGSTAMAPGRLLTSPSNVSLPDFSKWGPVRREKMNAVRRATARQMTLSWSQIPHVNSQDFVDISQLESFREEYHEKHGEKGVKLTLTTFALKAIATALKTYPRFNASLDIATEEIVIKDYYHIGIAVDTEDGLIVPVIRDVDRKSIVEIAEELADLVQRTRSRKTKLEEMQGGSFTITNAGALGGGYFAPIINFPEVAIMGFGQARRQPVVRETSPGNFNVVPRMMLPMILSIDHRVLDGADAIRFLEKVKNALEDPQELMMTMI